MTDDDEIIQFDDPEDPGTTGDDTAVPLSEPADPTTVTEEAPPSVVDSPMDRLRAVAAERFASDTRAFRLPGWDGSLAVELRVLSPKDTKRLRAAAELAKGANKGAQQSNAHSEIYSLLASAAVGLCTVTAGEAKPLVENGDRVGWDAVSDLIPQQFQNPNRSDRQGVIDAFRQGPTGQLNEFALMRFVQDVALWLSDTTADIDSVVDLVVDTDGNVVSESINSGS